MPLSQLLKNTLYFGRYQHIKTAYLNQTHTAIAYHSTRLISKDVKRKNKAANQFNTGSVAILYNVHPQPDEQIWLQKNIHADYYNTFSCSICYQPFKTSIHPLSLEAKKTLKDGSCVCVGCRRYVSF
jgi:hypothetical protein